jgi:hypothetical protein
MKEDAMYLIPRALSLATGFLFSVLTFLIGLGGLASPGYGSGWLDVAASIFPGYANGGTIVDLIVGALYAFVFGVVVGWSIAYLYNRQVVPGPDGKVMSFWAHLKHHGLPPSWAIQAKHLHGGGGSPK